ncbi:DUF6882 domain-containing protein [Streptomyces sp. NPDC054840]
MITRFGDPFLSETERHTAWGVAQLEALGSFLPEGPWAADLPSCLYRQGALELRVSVLGTYDTEERSWMWGWANPGLKGTEVVALSAAVERYGRAHGIAELTAPTLDLSGFPDPRRAAETLAFAGMGVAQASGYIGDRLRHAPPRAAPAREGTGHHPDRTRRRAAAAHRPRRPPAAAA